MLNKSDNTTHKSDLSNGKSDPFRSYGIWSVYTVVVWVYGLWSVIY